MKRLWPGLVSSYVALERFIVLPPTVLGITPVAFLYTAWPLAANFKFSNREAPSGTIGHH